MMDLTIDCPHCEAKVGEFCKENCEVNGEKIGKLAIALMELDLTLENIIKLMHDERAVGGGGHYCKE